MKIAGTIEKFNRSVLKAKWCQQTSIKKRSGRLDTPPLIFKSHKTICSEQSFSEQFLRVSSFCFLFLPQHMTGRTVLRKKSYAWTHMGMHLTHDGATFQTARKTVNLLQANRVNYLAIQIIDLNHINHICPTSGTLLAV